MVSLTKLRANVKAAIAVDNDVLQGMIDRAVDFLETQTRHYFGPVVTVTEYLNGAGSRHLYLAEPIAVVDSDSGDITVEERPYPGAVATVIAIDEFQARPAKHQTLLVRGGSSGAMWTRGLEYAVTYEQGYAVDGLPGDIEQLVMDLIALRLKFLGKEGMRSESIGGYSYTRFGEGDLDSIDGAKATIEAWRRPVFA